MDSQYIEAIMIELQELLPGASISKIHQPSAESLVFKLWTGRETHRLLISVASDRARIHLTRHSYPNPPAPARFCQLLRARLSRLLKMEQVPGKRIVRLEFGGKDAENHSRYTLVAELTSHHGNLVLLDREGRIIDVLKRTKGLDGKRELLPGRHYQLPPFPPGVSRKNKPEVPEFSSSPSRAADDFYKVSSGQSDGMDERRALQTVVRRHLKRLASRRNRIEMEQTAAECVEDLRQTGELLLANLHRLRKGMTAIELENYYVDPPVPIAIVLEPRLNPRENAEKFFHRYKKLKRSRDHIVRRTRETEEERLWLEEVALALEEAENAEDLAAIRRELTEARLLQPPPRSSGPRAGSDPGRRVREAVTPGGYRLFWGTGNRVNDHVTRHLCKADDLWFHALNLPGCHLVLKRDHGEEVPEADQFFAASLAAGYSRGKNEGKVEVMVTEGKWVQKPKGARPGLVTVKHFRTLLVAPRRMD
jgi:predicted ribosome quality control (RQC) complex YloA/Tae2 family protein